jgi:hypothetical protein
MGRRHKIRSFFLRFAFPAFRDKSIFVVHGTEKLIRFAAIKEFANVLEYPTDMAGNWAAFLKTSSRLS